MRPRWGSNLGLTDRLIVGRNVTLILTLKPAVIGWREMVASLLGREPGSRGTSAVGSNVTENNGLCVIVSCEV
jgi:hypothetical protein